MSNTEPNSPRTHYAPGGEWGGQRVNCGRYYTTDVSHSGLFEKITCKFCLELFKKAKNGKRK